MKTYLITGASGFIGSHLAERLLKEGIRVKALTLKTSIAVLIINHEKNFQLIDTLQINEVRKKILNSPPVKRVSSNSAVVKVINYLN